MANARVPGSVQPQAETEDQASARLARERAEASERELAAFRAQEEERRRSIAPITEALPQVELSRLGAPEEQAARSRIARDLMAEQQAGQRQLLAQQAKQGVRGGAAAAQQSQLSQRIAAQRAAQEEAGFMQQRMFNIGQEQKSAFANVASELARRQLMAALRGQDVQAEAARQFGAQQLQTAQQSGGKVICSELYFQGLMDEQTFKADQSFGQEIMVWRPSVMLGYLMWAIPVVKLMQKSKMITTLVCFIATPWAKEMAFRMGVQNTGSKIGSMMMAVGIPLCAMLGNLKVKYATAN